MKRLADDPQAPLELHTMIAAARSDVPAAATLERILARIEGGGGSTPSGGGGRLALIAGGAGIAVVAAFFILRGAGGDGERADRVRPASPPQPAATLPAAAPPLVSPLADESVAVAPPAPPAAKRRAHSRRPAPAEPAPPSPPSEVSLVEAARAGLAAGDFAAALAAADQHAARYPDGVLGEEREAIAVEALAGASRTDAARARLAGFVRRYPRSSYRRHLEEALR